MRKTLLTAGLTLLCMGAAPEPTTKPSAVPPSGGPAQRYFRYFAVPSTRPTPLPIPRLNTDPMMPNALPPRYDLRRLPRYPVPLTPQAPSSTQPSQPTPYLMLPDGAHVLPPGCKVFRFNGEDVYVIPLRELHE